ncbi:MAG: hypothetical protein JWO25_2122, partial [Alphaproteobacteria bacterium]|nr:hypothetical protein [Alphaproteobacteria bacterium]
MDLLIPTLDAAPPPIAPAASATLRPAEAPHPVGSVQGWGLCVRLLLWSTRADR